MIIKITLFPTCPLSIYAKLMTPLSVQLVTRAGKLVARFGSPKRVEAFKKISLKLN